MNDIFLSSESPDNSHRLVVEGDGRSVWAYLRNWENEEIISDAPVCSLVPLITVKEFKEEYSGQGAPPFVQGYFSEDSVDSEMKNERISIAWRDESVEVLLDQQVVTKIEFKKKRGSSRFIIQICPWGEPLKTKGEPVASGQRR